jgi:hypothetical protein
LRFGRLTPVSERPDLRDPIFSLSAEFVRLYATMCPVHAIMAGVPCDPGTPTKGRAERAVLQKSGTEYWRAGVAQRPGRVEAGQAVDVRDV